MNWTPKSVASGQLSVSNWRLATESRQLSLAELEPFASALLAVLLALFATRIARNHTRSLELLPQFHVENHQGAGDAHLHRIGLAVHAAAGDRGNHVECAGRLAGCQRRLRRAALRVG